MTHVRDATNPPRTRVRRRTILKQAIQKFFSHDCPQLAATIAFYGLFSGIPALALIVASFGLLLQNEGVRQDVTNQVLDLLPFSTRQNRMLVGDALRALQLASGGLTFAGLAGLAWSAFGMLAAIRWALNRVWGVPGRKGLVRPRLIDLLVALALWALIFLSLAGTTVLHTLRSMAGTQSDFSLPFLWNAAQLAVPAVFTFASFLLLFRTVPNVDAHRIAHVWRAAIAGTILFELGKHGFAWYVTTFSRHEALYGSLGSLMLFMLWTYLSANILLFAAELAAARGALSRDS
jgi:membrane protein